MLPELGQIALILALLTALCQTVLPMVGAARNDSRLIALARPAAYGQAAFVALAFALLTAAFVTQDFSVAYVAQHSNRLLPLHYRFTAVWGAHEGSILLWSFILALWTVALARFSHALPERFVAQALAVMGFIAVGFLAFLLFPSNPFLRHLPALTDGNDLNPLLQDPGMIMHPPMLYIGYVGFSVAFAFSIAALLDGRTETDWVRWARRWTLVAWAFLTLGITLGSWWAYYELGWGGWWFWDPVENASFMPWLVGTALIHSQAVSDKRGSFRGWTLLLAIFAFSLSLLGTFLVRSGVLTSVHAFASDPARGAFILVFLAVMTGSALLLYAIRMPKLGTGQHAFSALSRETLLLLNNLLLASACAMVLLGTLYPLIAEALGWGKISVGPPYFGTLFILLMGPLALLLPLGPFARWQREYGGTLVAHLRLPAAAALVLALLVWLNSSGLPFRALAGTIGASWVVFGTLAWMVHEFRDPARRQRFTAERAGMAIAHLGMGVFVLGALVVEATGVEKDLRMKPGETTELGAYSVTFEKMSHYDGPNYKADRGDFVLRRTGSDDVLARLAPEKRLYTGGGQIMTESAIAPSIPRDVYLALGEPLGDDGAWAVRVYLKPYVRCVWLGGLLMMLGGLVAAGDRRLSAWRERKAAAPAGAVAA